MVKPPEVTTQELPSASAKGREKSAGQAVAAPRETILLAVVHDPEREALRRSTRVKKPVERYGDFDYGKQKPR